MHEVSLIEETLNLALEYAQRENSTRIHSLKMSIGQNSGVVPEALQFAFEVVKKGTIAENALLQIDLIPVTCYCYQCKQEFQPTDCYDYFCPDCKQISFDIIKGKEIELTSLEVS
jgi:hydrogenase nickel incorporation protein HypA/HybF